MVTLVLSVLLCSYKDNYLHVLVRIISYDAVTACRQETHTRSCKSKPHSLTPWAAYIAWFTHHFPVSFFLSLTWNIRCYEMYIKGTDWVLVSYRDYF